jgi:hypothetical protein
MDREDAHGCSGLVLERFVESSCERQQAISSRQTVAPAATSRIYSFDSILQRGITMIWRKYIFPTMLNQGRVML